MSKRDMVRINIRFQNHNLEHCISEPDASDKDILGAHIKHLVNAALSLKGQRANNSLNSHRAILRGGA